MTSPATQSTGLTPWQEARYVVIPQAVRIAFPALGSNLVSLLKNTSLVSTIGMVEERTRTEKALHAA